MSVSARIAALAVGVIALGAGIAACSDDDSGTDGLKDELAAVTAERDELQALVDVGAERHDKAVETVETLRGILDDPASYGSEEEVVDLLASLATPSAQMRDDAFGDVGIESAWYNTLYRGPRMLRSRSFTNGSIPTVPRAGRSGCGRARTSPATPSS